MTTVNKTQHQASISPLNERNDFILPITLLVVSVLLAAATGIGYYQGLGATQVYILAGSSGVALLGGLVSALVLSQLKPETKKIPPRQVFRTAQKIQALPPQILFIGAGPVGIWTAIQLKARLSNVEIVFLEKYDTSQRTHLLTIDSASLRGIPKLEALEKLVEELKSNPNIGTNVLQEKLLKIADQMGIIFRTKVNVTNPSALKREYPRAKLIIGSDGSHSVVRKTIFKDKLRVKKDFQYVLEIKYETHGKAIPLPLNSIYRSLKVMKTIATETLGKVKKGVARQTVRIFIDQESYNQLKDKATFKKPLKFGDKLPEKIAKHYRLWLNQKTELGERRVLNSEKITVTPLGIYESEEFVLEIDGITYILVGDAALGVPYFRSLNNGFLEGTKLAQVISDAYKKGSLDKAHFSDYTAFMKKLAKQQIFVAKAKKTSLQASESFVKVSAWVPWEVNKFSKKEVTRLTETLFVAPSAA